MKPAYIDTSLLIGLRFQGFSPATVRRIERYELYSGELLIAEMLAFGTRESIPEDQLWDALKGLSWVIPEGSLVSELTRIGHSGYARGSDLWHLACAWYLSPIPGDLAFLTVDERQRELASRIGFQAPALNP